MKNKLIILGLMFLILLAGSVSAQNLLDDFGYGNGDLNGNGAWILVSGGVARITCEVSDSVAKCDGDEWNHYQRGGLNATTDETVLINFTAGEKWWVCIDIDNGDIGYACDGACTGACAYYSAAVAGGTLGLWFNGGATNTTAGLGLSATDNYYVRSQRNTTGDETYRVKIWHDGIPEPPGWNLSFNAVGQLLGNGTSVGNNGGTVYLMNITDNEGSPLPPFSGWTEQISQSYESNALEDTSSPFQINFIEYNITNSSTATLTYNQTTYSGSFNYTNQSYISFSANSTVPIIYLNNTAVTFYWNYTLDYKNGSQRNSSTTDLTQNVFWDLISYPRVNISAYDLNALGWINSFSLNDTFGIKNTLIGYIYSYQAAGGNYNVTFQNASYQIKTDEITYHTGNFTSYSFYVYTTNSLVIHIKDEDSNLPIYQNISIKFTNDEGEFTNSTNASYFYIDNLNVSEYTLLFSSSGYSDRTYTVTIGNRSSQTLNAYLAQTSNTVLFTITDQDTSEALDAVKMSMYRFINGSWQTIESKYSDITGKVQFTYSNSTSINYKFFLAKTNYEDYVFYLNPILFASYDIAMTKETIINYTQDLDQIAVIYSPSSFNNDNTTFFNFIISSPGGELIEYGITLTYPGGSNSTTGGNAIGEQLSLGATITNATVYDFVKLEYYYTTSLTNGRREFTVMFPINFPYGSSSNTFMKNKTTTYGLGIFERLLVATLMILVVVGIATLIGQPIPGFALGLFIYGYLTLIGFIPLWAILSTMFVGIIFLIWRSG